MEDHMTSTNYVLEARNISKSFPGVKALDDVNLCIEKGKVHALMGENGAGKSTLMKILMGLLPPDSGTIYLKGNSVNFSSAHDALKAGISMIHQELMPFPNLSVAENIFMGNEPTKFLGWIDKTKMYRDAVLLMERLGADIRVTRMMNELSVAEMQLVEIAKALSNKSQVIIMDEPTSAIAEKEVATLFKLICDLKQQDLSIIYISHKMDEILKISDTITVMRDGKYIGTYDKSEVDQAKLISLIVGRELSTVFEKRNARLGETFLSVQGLTSSKFKNINFHVKKGEIVGLAGLMGSGRTEIVNALFGIEKIIEGEIKIRGKKVEISSPRMAMKYGLGLVSEDRKKFGLVLKLSVKLNISLASLRKIKAGLFLDFRKENKIVEQQIINFRIKTPSRNQIVNHLSGGNQQKVVLAKVLLNEPDIIIFDEPTKGIDIGAKLEIYSLITQLSLAGKAIILVSSELPEILGMSDRILVIHNGALKAELTNDEASPELIMKHAML
jgi:inositol transport system ATP-binding protein